MVFQQGSAVHGVPVVWYWMMWCQLVCCMVGLRGNCKYHDHPPQLECTLELKIQKHLNKNVHLDENAKTSNADISNNKHKNLIAH